MAQVGVIGAGIAGLTAAHRLQPSEHDVEVLEASDRVGGMIRSERSDGFLVEHGPNSLQGSTAELSRTLDELGLRERVVSAHESASTRYVVREGRPVALPMSLADFVTTSLFSTRAKLRLLAEPFMSRRSDEGAGDESVADFIRRRLGSEVLDYAVAPFVGGVFAGRPEELSVRHAFEQLAEWESESGSVFWGGLRQALVNGSSDDDGPAGPFSFQDGLQTLPAALGAALEGSIRYNTRVAGLSPEGETVTVAVQDGPTRRYDAVVSTLPLHTLRDIPVETPVDLQPLREVSYPPIRVVALGYERDAIAHPLDGFGLLVPPIEDDFDILGTLFSSTLFPGRAPDGHVLLTTFVGGARAPEQARASDADVRTLVERDLDRLLGVTGTPGFVRQVHWDHAIPQYALGYDAVQETLSALEQVHSGLFWAGNYRHGVSVGDTMASGAAAARRLVEALSNDP